MRAELAEVSPLVGAHSPARGREFKRGYAVAVVVTVACVCLVGKAAVSSQSFPSVLASLDPRMGGMDGLGILGTRQRIQVPSSAQQLAVDSMSDVRERAHGPLGYVPRQAKRGSIWSGLDDSVGRLPGVNVDAWGAMKQRDGVETPAMLRRAARHNQLHHVQAGGVLSRLPSEQEPDVLERVGQPEVVEPRQAPVEVVPVEEGVLARAPMTGEGDGLLGRIAAPRETVESREAGGVLMAEGEDEKTAQGALMQTGNDDAATEGVLSHDFGLDAENTGGSLFMQSVHGDDGWMAAPKDSAWAQAVHDDSWKLDSSRSASGALAQVGGDDMAKGALYSLSAQRLQPHRGAAARAAEGAAKELRGGEEVTGSLAASKTEDPKELVEGSLAAAHNAFGDAGSLSRVKTIDELQAEAAATRAKASAQAASRAVHRLQGGEEVEGSLASAPTEHAKELVEGSLAATHAAGKAGAGAAQKSSAKKVVEEASMAAKIVKKLQEAQAVAKKINNVGGARRAAVVESPKARAEAEKAAEKHEAVVQAQEAAVKSLVKETMKGIKHQRSQPHAQAHAAAASKVAHAKHVTKHVTKHVDASGSAVRRPAAKATLQAKKGWDLFPKERLTNALNQTEGGEEDEMELGENWDDVGWVKHQWTLTTWALFVLCAPVFTIAVTGLVAHTAGWVAALCAFILLFSMDIACYYYSWFLF